MKKLPIHYRVAILLGVAILIGFYFLGQSNDYKETNLKEKQEEIAKEEAEKPIYKGGYLRYGSKRIKLTNTPQRYTFDKSGDWGAWYDNPETALPFIVQFSIDGEKLDCKAPAVNHPPLGEIWVSKYPENPEQYVTFTYSFGKLNPLN